MIKKLRLLILKWRYSRAITALHKELNSWSCGTRPAFYMSSTACILCDKVQDLGKKIEALDPTVENMYSYPGLEGITANGRDH